MNNRQTEATEPNLENLQLSNNPEEEEQSLCLKAKKESYGDNFQQHLLEQYKLYVEMTDRVSARRLQTNTFYVSLLSGLLVFLSLVIDKSKNLFLDYQYLLLAAAILGLILCLVWCININSYKQLNSLKFKVIHEMEKELPYACYFREWEILKQENKSQTYRRLNKIEKSIPFIMAIPYLSLLVYSLYILV